MLRGKILNDTPNRKLNRTSTHAKFACHFQSPTFGALYFGTLTNIAMTSALDIFPIQYGGDFRK